MASEVFLAVFRVHASMHVMMRSNESCLRWWINENICTTLLHPPTYVVICCSHAWCECEGHHPKVLLWIMEEFFYISHDLTEEYRNGHVILSYELMMEAEH